MELVDKLIEAGEAVIYGDAPKSLLLIAEAQDHALKMQRQVADLLRENELLRRPSFG